MKLVAIMIRRRIKANDYLANSQYEYADNYIKTSKYTLLTFLPLNLFEQFRRLANTYFLCLLILQLIPQISSLTPITTAVPLIVVLAITGIKDAHDDICRHQSDNQVNNRLGELLKNGQLVREPWHKVKVGDIIRIENDQFVAADLMILSTSEPNGFCFVETAELDGETNLKCRQSLMETAALGDDIKALASFDGEIICEPPNNNLTKFEGTLFWEGQKYPIDNDKLLLRGCILRNTKWCFGLVVFAGRDTKLMQNSGKTIFKRTKSDRLLNILIMGIVLALLTMCLFSSLACGIWEMLSGRYFIKFLPREPFIPQDSFTGATITAILTFFSYLIVLNTVVPISLYVSVEVIRYCQSLLIDFDLKMYYAPKDAYAKARTTTLNEELGQVEYVFSDKTGTLTQNLMTFNKCSINGRLYGEVKDYATGEMIDITNENEHLFEAINFAQHNPKFAEEEFKFYDVNLLDQVQKHNKEVHEFFTLLALCHTVMSEEKNGKLEYQAQSPDEAALSAAARNFGFVFKTRTSNTVEIEVLGEEQTYELLAILDFNNVRKRMSVIVRAPNGKIILYCKGADSVIMEHLGRGPTSNRIRDLTSDHLEHFAGVGLRTLCLAKKDLSEEIYEKWSREYHNAVTSIENREEKVDKCYEDIEQDLQLLGATAIEDKLQDNVPQTIANLIAANIKVWVLTGDKQETAINIGFSCELLNDEMCEIFIVDGCYPEEVDKQLKRSQKTIQRMLRYQQFGGGANSISGNLASGKPISRINNAQVRPSNQQVASSTNHHNHQHHLNQRPNSRSASRSKQRKSRAESRARSRNDWSWSSQSNLNNNINSNNNNMSNMQHVANANHQPQAKRKSPSKPARKKQQLDENNNNNNSNQISINLGGNDPTGGMMMMTKLDGESMNSESPVIIDATNLIEQMEANQLNSSANDLSTSGGQQPTRLQPNMGKSPSPTNRSTPSRPASQLLGGGDPAGGFALVINGHSLAHALCPNREQLFLAVASQCKSVICCRVTPLQKALVVDLVKRHKKVITLSIGDGANDVSMLKMAHIGVGISGQEGMQAVLASDFSVAQFSYLERLLLVHGRWSYFRMCKFLRYFFYKNFSFTLCNLWYAFFCGFSAQVSCKT